MVNNAFPFHLDANGHMDVCQQKEQNERQKGKKKDGQN